MFIIKFFNRENSRSQVFLRLLEMMDPPDPDSPLTPVPQKKTKRKLTGKERQQIVSRSLFEMQNSSVDGKFLRGKLTVVAGDFHETRRTINRVWARAQENFQNPDSLQFRASPSEGGDIS